MEAVVSIDTNVLVRFLVEDGGAKDQCRLAKGLFEKHTVFLPESVLLEAEWVLRAVFAIPRGEIHSAFRMLLRLKQVNVPDRGVLLRLLEYYEQGFDFGDALHLLRSQGYPMKTFDRDFSNNACQNGFEVSLP